MCHGVCHDWWTPCTYGYLLSFPLTTGHVCVCCWSQWWVRTHVLRFKRNSLSYTGAAWDHSWAEGLLGHFYRRSCCAGFTGGIETKGGGGYYTQYMYPPSYPSPPLSLVVSYRMTSTQLIWCCGLWRTDRNWWTRSVQIGRRACTASLVSPSDTDGSVCLHYSSSSSCPFSFFSSLLQKPHSCCVSVEPQNSRS